MKRTHFRIAALAAVSLLGVSLIVTLPVQSQPQAKAMVQLQSLTPGTGQNGHLRITGTGLFGTRVGVGTLTPGDPLTVFGQGYGLVHTNGATELGTYVDGLGGWLGTRSIHPLYFFAGNSQARMTGSPVRTGWHRNHRTHEPPRRERNRHPCRVKVLDWCRGR